MKKSHFGGETVNLVMNNTAGHEIHGLQMRCGYLKESGTKEDLRINFENKKKESGDLFVYY